MALIFRIWKRNERLCLVHLGAVWKHSHEISGKSICEPQMLWPLHSFWQTTEAVLRPSLCFPSQQPWQLLLLSSHLTFSVSSEWEGKSDGRLWTGQAEAFPELCLLHPSFPGHTLQGTYSQGQQVPFSGRLHLSCLSWGKLVLPPHPPSLILLSWLWLTH